MTHTLNLLLPLLQLTLCICLLARRRTTPAPTLLIFAAYLLAAFAVNIDYSAESHRWWTAVLPAFEMCLFIPLRLLVTLEAYIAAYGRVRVTWLNCGALAIGGAVAYAVAALSLPPMGAVVLSIQTARAYRAAELAGLAVVCGIVLVFQHFWRAGKARRTQVHYVLWTLLLLDQGTLAVCGRFGLLHGWAWHYADNGEALFRCALLLCWIYVTTAGFQDRRAGRMAEGRG